MRIDMTVDVAEVLNNDTNKQIREDSGTVSTGMVQRRIDNHGKVEDSGSFPDCPTSGKVRAATGRPRTGQPFSGQCPGQLVRMLSFREEERVRAERPVSHDHVGVAIGFARKDEIQRSREYQKHCRRYQKRV